MLALRKVEWFLKGEMFARAYDMCEDKIALENVVALGDYIALYMFCNNIVKSDLYSLSRKTLLRMADTLNVRRYTRLTKDELIVAIKGKQNV